MVHEFPGMVASMATVAIFAAGYCGLLICRETLRSVSASDLRREAAMSMLTMVASYALNSRLQAAVSIASYESIRTPERLTLPGRSPGLRATFTEGGKHA